MRLIARGSEESPWKIDPAIVGDMEETTEGVSLNAALWEAAEQVASDAGSDELEDPFDWTRTAYRVAIFNQMQRVLHEVNDYWRAPDGTLFLLEEDPAEPDEPFLFSAPDGRQFISVPKNVPYFSQDSRR